MCAAMQNIVDMMKVITVVRSLAYIQNIQGMAWVIPHKPRLHHRDGRHTTRQTTKTNIHKPTCITWIIYHLSLSPYIHLSQSYMCLSSAKFLFIVFVLWASSYCFFQLLYWYLQLVSDLEKLECWCGTALVCSTLLPAHLWQSVL